MAIVVGFNWPIIHDNTTAAIVDGRLVFASEEERFTRHKHSPNEPPKNSLIALLNYIRKMGIKPSDIDAFALNFDPKLYSLRYRLGLVFSSVVTNVSHFNSQSQRKQLASSIFNWFDYSKLSEVLVRHVFNTMGESLPNKIRIIPVEHHLAHAASAHYFSGFATSNIITIDGVGETESTVVWNAKGGDFEKICKLDYNHSSVGRLYEVISEKLGFHFLEGPGKVMGLAPYGEKSEYYDKLRTVVNIWRDHNPPYYLATRGNPTATYDPYIEMADRILPPIKWNPRESMDKDAADIAWAIQKITEEIMIAIAEFAKQSTGDRRLSLAGGVALNAKATMELHYSKMFDDIFVFPAANDSGSTIGAAAYVYEHVIGEKMFNRRLTNAYLGPEYADGMVRTLVNNSKFKVDYIGDDVGTVSELVARGKIVCWYQGRAELGPRALGNRSIIADPRDKGMWEKMNSFKGREWWRPLAPSLLEQELNRYFVEGKPHQFMVLMYKFAENVGRAVPAVCHVDSTARPQTVTSQDNRNWYNMIESFKGITGEGLVVNTSFNLAGEPIVETPQDAFRSFAISSADAIYLQGWLVSKPLA